MLTFDHHTQPRQTHPHAPDLSASVLQVVGDYFGMGMDDTHIKMRGAPVLDEPALSRHSKMIADKLTVSELMSMAVVALPPVVRVRPCSPACFIWRVYTLEPTTRT